MLSKFNKSVGKNITPRFDIHSNFMPNKIIPGEVKVNYVHLEGKIIEIYYTDIKN